MRANRRRDTAPERRVRSALHALGLRFRVDYAIRVGTQRPIRPDIVFTRARVAVFIDGCFWHGCPEHGQRPSIKNGHYWTPKIGANVARDQQHVTTLESARWTVLRFWEHDPTDHVVAEIQRAHEAGLR
jgi:DNA mismatch endonuclease (patch repair protein)